MEIYLAQQEMERRLADLSASVQGMLAGVNIPLVKLTENPIVKLLIKQFLPDPGELKAAVVAPGGAALIEGLLRQMASVYGYDLVFVKEVYRNSIEGAAAAELPPDDPEENEERRDLE